MKSLDDIQEVAVLGAGTMGHGIAQVAAQAGCNTVLYDISDVIVETGRAAIAAMLDKGVQKGKVSEEQRETTLARITTSTMLQDAVIDADAVIEAAPEKLDLKREIFSDILEVVSNDCILATNTSSLSISAIAECLPEPDRHRFVGLHFFNPPPLMKLLEIVRGDLTSDVCVEACRALGERLGKDPIVVRDAPGFASSRLGIVLGLEAIRMVQEDVASVADIDKAMELGYRHPMGPLKLTDLVGLDVRLAIAEYLAQELDDTRFEPPQLLCDMVAQGKLGKKTGSGFYDW